MLHKPQSSFAKGLQKGCANPSAPTANSPPLRKTHDGLASEIGLYRGAKEAAWLIDVVRYTTRTEALAAGVLGHLGIQFAAEPQLTEAIRGSGILLRPLMGRTSLVVAKIWPLSRQNRV
ncbi:hypothetical protein [Bradyrhizobium genosp. A]|uniref:hypothetical protein n=1 Tax=Bradyrhizobium genosp. A TaxID=83626 RepID=UPI003CF28E19